MDLVFGWRTAVLSVAAGILLPLAFSLSRAMRNRVAARTLAAVLVAMVGVFVPWLIGFAGLYDQWRWLTFLPVANALLVPPLLYLHAYALANGAWPRLGWRHLVPGTLQFLYQTACFVLPLPLKLAWARKSLPVTEPVFGVLLAVSFWAYGVQSARLLRRYRRAVARQRSDDALFAADWLQRSIAAIGLLALIWAAFLMWDAVSPLGYYRLMPLYVAIAGFALYLGIAGWRYLAVEFPTFADVEIAERPGPERDWAALGVEWEERVRAQGWYRKESITLRQLAALLGTNSSYLSRALNEGRGIGFSDFINAMRCDEVAQALRDGSPRPVLEMALEAGFASKASFNRCFRARFGQAPSGIRRQRLTS